jgi:hypothetical protein
MSRAEPLTSCAFRPISEAEPAVSSPESPTSRRQTVIGRRGRWAEGRRPVADWGEDGGGSAREVAEHDATRGRLGVADERLCATRVSCGRADSSVPGNPWTTALQRRPIAAQEQATALQRRPIAAQGQATASRRCPIAAQGQAIALQRCPIGARRQATASRSCPFAAHGQALASQSCAVASQRLPGGRRQPRVHGRPSAGCRPTHVDFRKIVPRNETHARTS